MKIQQIRNATIIIEYAGKRFLVDPMLGEKGSFAPFPFSHHQELRNPLHDLPMKAEEIVNNIDCVLLTHLHLDHIDNTAYELLNKKVHIFVQDEQDRKTVMKHGFTNVEIIGEDSRFGDIRLEGVNHNQVTRAAMREEVLKCGKADRIHIPEDGEIIEL